MTRPSDRALWHAVVETLRDGVLPHVTDEHAALQTQRLVGLATYARDRGDDPATVLANAADPRRQRLQSLLVSHLDADLAVEHVLLVHFGDPAVLPSGPGFSDDDGVPGDS